MRGSPTFTATSSPITLQGNLLHEIRWLLHLRILTTDLTNIANENVLRNFDSNTKPTMQSQPELQRKPGRLRDRIAIVTGGSNGIGQAIALAYAKEGAIVVVADLAPANGGQTAASTVDQITSEGGQALFHQTNVCDASSTSAVVAQAVEAYGRLDM